MKTVLSNVTRTAALFALTTGVALAADPAGAVATGLAGSNWGLGVGAGLTIGLAALGGGLGQGRTATAALEGMARNPAAAGNLFTPMMIALVFTETLVLFSFAIAGRMGGLF